MVCVEPRVLLKGVRLCGGVNEVTNNEPVVFMENTNAFGEVLPAGKQLGTVIEVGEDITSLDMSLTYSIWGLELYHVCEIHFCGAS